jgi:hypothetical protein
MIFTIGHYHFNVDVTLTRNPDGTYESEDKSTSEYCNKSGCILGKSLGEDSDEMDAGFPL